MIKFPVVAVHTASVLQNCTALLSAEAEFMALWEASKIIVWIRRVLAEFGIVQNPSIVYQDNNGIINWAPEDVRGQFSKRKHIDDRYHYII